MSLECYRKMYALLCGAASDAVDLLEEPENSLQAKYLLEQALLTAEELYVTWEEQNQGTGASLAN